VASTTFADIIEEFYNLHQSVRFTRMWGFYLEGVLLWRISGGWSSNL